MGNWLWKLFDGPLAIVVGAVALVQVLVQLAALGSLAGDQLNRDGERGTQSQARQQATLQCLESSNRSLHAQCLLQVAERRASVASLESLPLR